MGPVPQKLSTQRNQPPEQSPDFAAASCRGVRGLVGWMTCLACNGNIVTAHIVQELELGNRDCGFAVDRSQCGCFSGFATSEHEAVEMSSTETAGRAFTETLEESYEPLSKLLVSPLIPSKIIAHMIP